MCISKNPQISVIVPVYNVEKYIRECVESVLAQTFSDWELILVDDGSQDKSGMICDEYARNDSRIKVFHQENGGVSRARNFGLSVAKGEYITFIDSDDYIDTFMFELYYNAIIEQKVDCVVSGLTFLYSSKDAKSFFVRKGKMIFPLEINAWYREFDRNFVFCAACAKLYRRQTIIECGLIFDEDFSILEDGMFVIDYLFCCKSVYSIDYSPYYYRQHDGTSLMKQYNSNALFAWETYFLKFKRLFSYLDTINRIYANEAMLDIVLNFMHQIYSRSSLKRIDTYFLTKKYVFAIHEQGILKEQPMYRKMKWKRGVILFLIRNKMVLFLHCGLLIRYKKEID